MKIIIQLLWPLAALGPALSASAALMPGESPAQSKVCLASWAEVKNQLGPSVADRGWIGMVLRPIPSDSSDPTSPKLLTVDMVMPGSPANGKLFVGDFITRLDGRDVIGKIAEAETLLRGVKVNGEVRFSGLRGSDRFEVAVRAVPSTDPRIMDAWILGEAGFLCGDAARERLMAEMLAGR